MNIFPSSGPWSVSPEFEGQFRAWSPSIHVTAEAIHEVSAARTRSEKGVAIIGLRGVMDKMPSLFMAAFGGTSTALTKQAIRRAGADSKVKSIMLSVDSPGGSVEGLAELADEIMLVRAVKPVFAQVDGVAASAAYYVASQATQIFSHRMDKVGSIGTLMQWYDFSKKFEKEGVEAVNIASGPFKGMGMIGAALTPEHRKHLQSIVDAHGNDFKNMVSRGRPRVDIGAVADGRMFFASEAVQNGLVDGIQTFEQTLAQALNVREPVNMAARAETLNQLEQLRAEIAD